MEIDPSRRNLPELVEETLEKSTLGMLVRVWHTAIK
jgi:hypothetical protein